MKIGVAIPREQFGLDSQLVKESAPDADEAAKIAFQQLMKASGADDEDESDDGNESDDKKTSDDSETKVENDEDPPTVARIPVRGRDKGASVNDEDDRSQERKSKPPEPSEVDYKEGGLDLSVGVAKTAEEPAESSEVDYKEAALDFSIDVAKSAEEPPEPSEVDYKEGRLDLSVDVAKSAEEPAEPSPGDFAYGGLDFGVDTAEPEVEVDGDVRRRLAMDYLVNPGRDIRVVFTPEGSEVEDEDVDIDIGDDELSDDELKEHFNELVKKIDPTFKDGIASDNQIAEIIDPFFEKAGFVESVKANPDLLNPVNLLNLLQHIVEYEPGSEPTAEQSEWFAKYGLSLEDVEEIRSNPAFDKETATAVIGGLVADFWTSEGGRLTWARDENGNIVLVAVIEEGMSAEAISQAKSVTNALAASSEQLVYAPMFLPGFIAMSQQFNTYSKQAADDSKEEEW